MAHPRHLDLARKHLAEGIPFGPRLYPCVCGAGRHQHGGAVSTGSCPDTGCKRYRSDLSWEVAYAAHDAQHEPVHRAIRRASKILAEQHRAKDPVLPGQWRIGVSDVDTCPRALWYRNLPPDDYEPLPTDTRAAEIGTIIHAGFEERLRLVYPWREYEQALTVPGLDRRSRFDWYDPVTATAGDIKTAGRAKWAMIGEHGPTEDTWGKVLLYGLAIEETGRPVEWVHLDYVNRDNGASESFTRPYDRKAAEGYRDRLVGYATALDLGVVLPRAGTSPDDMICTYCPARAHCWQVDQAAAAGRHPVSWVYLGPKPDEDALVAAIGEKVDAAASAGEAKRANDWHKDRLDGIPPGRYGDYEGVTTPTAPQTDWAGYAQRLQTFYDLPDSERPPLAELGEPTVTRGSYVRWKRVRKALLDKERRERGETTRGDQA